MKTNEEWSLFGEKQVVLVTSLLDGEGYYLALNTDCKSLDDFVWIYSS